MGTYANKTEVSASKSRDEIERTLRRYGTSGFMYGWDDGHPGDNERNHVPAKAMIQFRTDTPAGFRQVKIVIPMPDPKAAEKAYEQATRQRWRALALVVKAKLEAVESGITTFDEEFLAHIVMPNGRTVYEETRPQIAQAYETGEMPRLLPMPE